MWVDKILLRHDICASWHIGDVEGIQIGGAIATLGDTYEVAISPHNLLLTDGMYVVDVSIFKIASVKALPHPLSINLSTILALFEKSNAFS